MMGPYYTPREIGGVPAFTVAGEAVATMTDDGSDVRLDLSEPQFIDDVRTVTVGDVVRLPAHREWCAHAMAGGWLCSRTRGHDPYDYPHAAGGRTDGTGDADDAGPGKVYAVADPEPRETESERALRETLAETTRQLRLSEIREGRMKERAEKAENMISQIREYALEKMRDGTICKDGTREFLQHFDLPLWERTFDVERVVTLRITIDGDADAADEKADEMIRREFRYTDEFQDTRDYDTTEVDDD